MKLKEDKGQWVTKVFYESKKLKLIRIWDTVGLDYKLSIENILNNVKRIVELSRKKGFYYYINIIFYCIMRDRFQEEDGNLIKEIM